MTAYPKMTAEERKAEYAEVTREYEELKARGLGEIIAEKTGPHFAVGDTCYSWSEDTAVYNPDGKEIIARDNEVSILRKKDPSILPDNRS